MRPVLIENVATAKICQVKFSVFQKLKTKKLLNGRNCRGVAQPSFTDNNCPSIVAQGFEIDGAKYFQTRKIVENFLITFKIDRNGTISRKSTVYLQPSTPPLHLDSSS